MLIGALVQLNFFVWTRFRWVVKGYGCKFMCDFSDCLEGAKDALQEVNIHNQFTCFTFLLTSCEVSFALTKQSKQSHINLQP